MAAAGALGGFAAWGLAEPILGIRWVYGRDIFVRRAYRRADQRIPGLESKR